MDNMYSLSNCVIAELFAGDTWGFPWDRNAAHSSAWNMLLQTCCLSDISQAAMVCAVCGWYCGASLLLLQNQLHQAQTRWEVDLSA